MTIKVTFRVDKRTGELTLFEVEGTDLGDQLSQDGETHDEAHERIALEIGRVIGNRPSIIEVYRPASADTRQTETEQTETGQTETGQTETGERQKQTS